MKTLTELSGVLLRQAAEARPDQAEAAEPEAEAGALAESLGISSERAGFVIGALAATGDKLGDVRRVRVFSTEEAPKGSVAVGDHAYVVDRLAAAPPSKPRGRARDGGRPGERRGGERRGGERRGPPPGRGGFRGGRDIPQGGRGWALSLAPRDPGERQDRRKPPGKRPGGRRPAQVEARRSGEARPTAPRPPRGASGAEAKPQPDAPGAQAETPAGEAKRRRRRRRPRRGRRPEEQAGATGATRPEGTTAAEPKAPSGEPQPPAPGEAQPPAPGDDHRPGKNDSPDSSR